MVTTQERVEWERTLREIMGDYQRLADEIKRDNQLIEDKVNLNKLKSGILRSLESEISDLEMKLAGK